ncbi:MAG: rhodanese-like domain-containing protein, partial [Nannocystaceae bacterium]|nr:rhodanese-like domain-containing protein [Nannocystaceae bacterium]
MSSFGIFQRILDQGHDQIGPAELDAWRGRARIVDVREPAEFRGELGHLPGAELVPLATLAHTAQSWDRDAAIVVVCRSGGRSAAAQRLLASMGFRVVLDLRGGMLAVDAAGVPVQRGR